MKTLVLIACLVGCASVRSKADDAFEQGNYLAAADLYDQVVKDDPDDRSAQARRDDARNAVLRVLLFQAEQARTAQDDAGAAGKLDELLRRRDGWAVPVDPRLVPQIAAAVDLTGRWLAGAVATRVSSVGPLGGEALVHSYAALLAHSDFARVARDLAMATKRAGIAKCDTFVTATPYASWVAARYCAHFGVTREVPVLPNLANGLVIDGAISGETDDQTTDLRRALAVAFRGSVWFEAAAPTAAHATLAGHIAAAFGSHPVTRVMTWTESVPYTEYETSQESYEEPYDDTETYTESVPSTEYRTETVPCGDTTCTNTVPETVYHDETRTRTVTKYRTAYRTVTNPVTKYRDEEREFSYDAIERVGAYTSALTLQVDRELPVVIAAVESAFTQSGDDHDVSNSAAGVSPHRANLMSIEALATREQGRLAERFAQVLDERYGAVYCTLETYDVEAASACAYRDPSRTPPAAHAQLATLLGGDERFVNPLLAR
jgi:hypothetical protein